MKIFIKDSFRFNTIIAYLLIIIMSSSFVFLFLYLEENTRKINLLNKNVVVLDNNVYKLDNSLMNILKSSNSGKLYENSENDTTIELFNNLNNSIEINKQIYRTINVEKIKYLSLEIKSNLEKFIIKSKKVVNNVIELGNAEKGLIGEFYFKQKMCYNKIDLYAKNIIKEKFKNIVELGSAFINYHSIKNSDVFIKELDELINYLKFKTKVNYGDKQIIDILSEYKYIFQSIYNISVETGIVGKSGIVGDAQEIIFTMEGALNELSPEIEKYITAKVSFNRSVIVIGLIIITILGIILITIYLRSLSVKFKQLEKLAKSINEGSLEKSKKEIKGQAGVIIKSLNAHINNLLQYNSFINSLSEDNFKDDTSFITENDELGKSIEKLQTKLAEQKEKEILTQKEREQYNKQLSTLSDFGDVLRLHSKDIDKLSYEVIFKLVKYLNCVLGGIYLVNNETNQIELKAAYSFNQKKIAEKSISMGEGIIGVCAAEKITIHHKNLPEDYVKIVSGFGTALPKVLIAVPIVLAEKVYGVIELASFNEFSKNDIKFVETLCENIASTLS